MNKRVASLLSAYSIYSSIMGNHSNSSNYTVDFEKTNMKGKSAKEMGTANSRKKKSRKERRKQGKKKKWKRKLKLV